LKRQELDPQLPYIQVHRGVAAKAAQLAARCGLDYYRVRGVLDCLWEGLADRRILGRALVVGAVTLTADQVAAKILGPLGPGVTIDEVIEAGFLEPRGDGTYRVRGMSRYLDAERVRLKRRPGATPKASGSDPSPTPLGHPSDSPPTNIKPHSDPSPTPVRPGSDPAEVRGERREVRGDVDTHTAASAGAPTFARVEEATPTRPDARPVDALGPPEGDQRPTQPDPRPDVDRASGGQPDRSALCADFESVMGSAYLWSKVDGPALAALRREAPIAEIRRRWLKGLGAQGFLHAPTLPQLRQKWNYLASALPAENAHPTRSARALDRFEAVEAPCT
jgi:hypothetical protein